MSFIKEISRVVLASPSDIIEERLIVQSIVEEINQVYKDSVIGLELFSWEIDTSPGIHLKGPQGIIDEDLKIYESDIFIAIFHRRIGSGGTEHEIKQAIESWEKRKLPRVLIYFKEPGNVDLGKLDSSAFDQFQHLQTFKQEIAIAGCFYKEFGSKEDFESNLRECLNKYIKSRLPHTPRILPIDLGYIRFFTPSSSERPEVKRNCMANENELIRLVAHVGRSYLFYEGALFRDDVEKLLDRNIKFKLLIQNPWSEIGFAIALAEPGGLERIRFQEHNAFRLNIEAMVSLIKNSNYYKMSLIPTLTQYELLQKKYGNIMDCRLSNLDLPATCLITSDNGFFEPYLTVNLEERWRQSLHTFEIQFTNICPFYKTISDWFDFVWDMSIPYEIFSKEQDDLMKRFLARYEYD